MLGGASLRSHLFFFLRARGAAAAPPVLVAAFSRLPAGASLVSLSASGENALQGARKRNANAY